MRIYRVNGLDHKVYDSDDVLPAGLIVQSNWRKGQVGDWVKADDDCVIQVLRRGKMTRAKGKNRIREYIGTCTGTFPVSVNKKMDTSRRINIYSFGGNKSSEDIMLDRTELSKHEEVFVLYLASGMAPEDAYIKAFPTKNRNYAKVKSGQLVKTERIKTAMKEELKPIMEELGISEKTVLSGIKEISEVSDKEETRLKALFKLSDILDLEDKSSTKVTQVSGALFQGFTDKMLEEAERPKLDK
jgi:hypothetical protein